VLPALQRERDAVVVAITVVSVVLAVVTILALFVF
jgi:hypothetical protein